LSLVKARARLSRTTGQRKKAAHVMYLSKHKRHIYHEVSDSSLFIQMSSNKVEALSTELSELLQKNNDLLSSVVTQVESIKVFLQRFFGKLKPRQNWTRTMSL
jgi:hypothetical protein